MIQQEEHLAPVFTIGGKAVRSAGFRLTKEWNHITRREERVMREYFRVCDGGKWKFVSPSQRRQILV